MNEATIALTVMTGLLGLSFLGFLVWGIRSGQFHNIEDAKYQLFREKKPGDENEEKSGQAHNGGDAK